MAGRISPDCYRLFAVLLATHVQNREEYELARPRYEFQKTGIRLLSNTAIRKQLLLASLFAFAWQGAIGFLPTFLQIEKGFDPVLASMAFAALFFLGIFANLFGGSLADTFSSAVVMAFISAVAAVGLAVVVLATTTPVVITGIACSGLGLAGFWPVMQSHIIDTVPTDTKAGDYGAFSMVYIGIGSLGPVYVGVVADLANYRIAFVGLVLCLIVGFFIAVLLMRHK